MPFSWLPDASEDPHPRLTWLAQFCFAVVVRLLFRKEAVLPEGFQIESGSLVVSNHLSNSDVPILASVICRRDGMRFRFPLPFFATRDDIFERSFLRSFLKSVAWPEPLARLVGMVPVRWLLRILRARPIRRIPEFTLDRTLRALCRTELGGLAPERVLRADTLRRIEARCGSLPSTVSELIAIRRLGPVLAETWGLRRLRLAAMRHLKVSIRATIDRQLEGLAKLLEAGHVVYLAPEGTISKTGTINPLRQGAVRLYQRARQPPKIQPVAVSYDSMTRGRLRAVVRVGQPLSNLDPNDIRAFNDALKTSLLALSTITPSHLIAHFLSAGPAVFTHQTCQTWLECAVAAIREAGLALDPIFARVDMGKLVRTRLRWAYRHRLLGRRRKRWCRIEVASRKAIASAENVRRLNAGLDEVLARVPSVARQIEP